MISLKADNRSLITNAKYSYLNANYLSGVSAVVVINSNAFAADDYILFSNFGSETSEIVKISTVTSATHTLNLATATKFSHSESTKITVIKYNQVRFYHTATATFSATSPVTGYIDIQADSIYTLAYDTTNSTGFGWFVFYNSTTAAASSASNAIPYAGFGENSVKKILDSFFSLLNNKELKLISNEEAFSWLNEGYSIIREELNLVNKEYNVESIQTFSLTSGTAEYSLPSDFSDLISIWNGTDNISVTYLDIKEVASWNNSSSNSLKYYLRGNYIGFAPTPTTSMTVYVRYLSNSATLTSYYDNITLPNKADPYCIKDYMLFRSASKLNKPDGKMYYDLFTTAIGRMKTVAVKRHANQDSWSIDPQANI